MPADVVEKMKLGARPRFRIYKGGKMHKEIDGVLINEIEQSVNALLPEADD